MTIPDAGVAVPAVVRGLAGEADLEPVWRNGYGGLTFRARGGRFGEAGAYVKWGPLNPESTMAAEAARLRWAGRWVRVPRVIEHGADEEQEWLVSEVIPGESAVSPRWLAEPATAVRAVGEGLRALHEALPVHECPWSWEVPDRILRAEARGVQLPQALRDAPPVDRRVVCHADACVPNTLLDDDGHWTAHVDLGLLGTADRWADIAVASMSTEWNYGPGWEDALIKAYGLDPDRERLAYYRDLWNAT